MTQTTPRSAGFIALAFVLLVSACGGDGGLSVGDTAPDFALREAAGETVDLQSYRDQAVLLYFHMADG